MKNTIKIIIATIFLGLVATSSTFAEISVSQSAQARIIDILPTFLKPKIEPVACTEEAKICTDGTSVGRIGPNCNFAACPIEKKEEQDLIVKPCTKIYKPVCGVDESGIEKTFANKCVLENQKDFNLIREGICEKKIEAEPTPPRPVVTKPNSSFPNRPVACTLEYDPVCARIDTGIRCVTTPCPASVEKTFGNSCSAKAENARVIHNGVCGQSDSEKVQIALPAHSIAPEVSKEEKARVIFISDIKTSVSEESRRNSLKVFIGQNSEDGKEDEMNKKEASYKTVIELKSKNIFIPFDNYQNKLSEIYSQISENAKALLVAEKIGPESEVFKGLKDIQIFLNEAKDLKALSWVEFNSLLYIEEKEEAVEALGRAKENLKLTKESLKKASTEIKMVLSLIKKTLN